MFWTCAVLCLAIIAYSVLRVLPFADQQQCATVDQYKELKGKEYILGAQLDKCLASVTTNFNEINAHLTNRVAECNSLSEKLVQDLGNRQAKRAEMNTLCDESVCRNELTKCKEKQVNSTVENILNLMNL